jgi:uncharacterized protein (TIGR02444 family)
MNETLWDFSLRFYQLPGVTESCLDLQDRDGADVNMVLFALWAAACGQLLDAAAIAEADRMARPWRERVTQPLRAARRALKTGFDGFDATATAALRQQVMTTELESERLQQKALAAQLRIDLPGCRTSAAAKQNLGQYEALVGKSFGAARVEQLLQAFNTGCRGDNKLERTAQ